MDDTISRKAAIDALDGEIEIIGRTNAEAVKGYVRLVKDRLERLPSAQPDRQKGHWQRVSLDKYIKHADAWYRCDQCGAEYVGGMNYCGNCGCQMSEEGETK